MAMSKVGSIRNAPYLQLGPVESGLDIIESVSRNTENLKQKLVDTYLQKPL